MTQDAPSFEERTHSDMGVLGQRVAATETAIRDISTSVGQLRAETSSQISGLAASLGSQIGDLAKSFNSSRTTSVSSIIQNAAIVITVIIAILSPIMTFGFSMINRNDAAIEAIKATRFSSLDAEKLDAKFTHWFDILTARIVTLPQFDEAMRDRDKINDLEQEYQKAEMARLDKEIDRLSADAITRSESEAGQRRTDERITTIVGSMNELRHDFGSSFTIGDRLKGLEAEISEMRRSGTLPQQPAPKPAD